MSSDVSLVELLTAESGESIDVAHFPLLFRKSGLTVSFLRSGREQALRYQIWPIMLSPIMLT